MCMKWACTVLLPGNRREGKHLSSSKCCGECSSQLFIHRPPLKRSKCFVRWYWQLYVTLKQWDVRMWLGSINEVPWEDFLSLLLSQIVWTVIQSGWLIRSPGPWSPYLFSLILSQGSCEGADEFVFETAHFAYWDELPFASMHSSLWWIVLIRNHFVDWKWWASLLLVCVECVLWGRLGGQRWWER